MKKAAFVIALFAMIGGLAMAAAPAKDQQVTDLSNLSADPGATDRAQYWLDYFFSGPAGLYQWSGDFYFSNLFKPDPLWYPFGVLTVEVFAAQLDGASTTGANGVIKRVRVFSEAGVVLAEKSNIAGIVGGWNPVSFAASTAAVISSGNFWAGMWNSTSNRCLQGEATNWTTPPVEPFNCLNTTGGGTSGAAGPWLPSNCGDNYGTTSAAAVRVMVDDTVPVELMRFTIE